MELKSLHTNLKKLDVVDLAYKVLDDMSAFITDLNKKRLSETGKDSDGNSIGDYTEYTTILKDEYGSGIGAITDHVTGYNTGESYRSMFSSVISDELIVDTTTPQWSLFEEHFNNTAILGLTDSEIKIVQTEFNNRFIPLLYESILR